MGATQRQFGLALIAALALAGCRRERGNIQPSVWPGADHANTFLYTQRGTRPRAQLRYVEAWEAEWFDVPAAEPVPAVAHAGHRPLVTDLDHDGRLEIVTSSLAEAPATILNSEGAPLLARARSGPDWSRIRSSAVRIVPDDSVGWMVLSESSLSAPGSRLVALRLNQRVVALRVLPDSGRPYPSGLLECRDGSEGSLLWRHEFGARPDIMAVTDLDSDGNDELLVTTYGADHGAVADSASYNDSCHCVALRGDGSLLWQHGFGAHRYIGCTAGATDLDADGRQEVIVGVYSWLNDFGRLAVLDGATGELRAETGGQDSLMESHSSVGCADLDSDGRQEIVAAVCGAKAVALSYRFDLNQLTLAGRADLGHARDSGEVSECRLHGICDLDGDGKRELVLSRCLKRMLCPDPAFYPSTFDSCGLVILGSDLKPKQEIPLPVRVQDVTLCDLIPRGNIELLVLSDRLRLFSTETE